MHAKGVISGFSPKELAQEIHPGAYCKVKLSEHVSGYVIYDAEGRALVSAGSAKQAWRDAISVEPLSIKTTERTKVPNMDQQQKLHQLNGHLQGLYADLGIPHHFTERVESIDPRDDMIHLTFTHGEEDHADQLIRAARRSFASFGPEYWLPDNHPGAAQFRHTEHMQFKVRKSLIVSHLYWGVSFILCGPDEGYSLVEDTQP